MAMVKVLLGCSTVDYILQIYWDWIGNGVLITEGAMIISNSHG